MFILDTNVVSELRKAKPGKADRRVVEWAAGVPPEAVFISAITLPSRGAPHDSRFPIAGPNATCSSPPRHRFTR